MRKAAARNTSFDLSAHACIHETVDQISGPSPRGVDARDAVARVPTHDQVEVMPTFRGI